MDNEPLQHQKRKGAVAHILQLQFYELRLLRCIHSDCRIYIFTALLFFSDVTVAASSRYMVEIEKFCISTKLSDADHLGGCRIDGRNNFPYLCSDLCLRKRRIQNELAFSIIYESCYIILVLSEYCIVLLTLFF